MADILIGKFYCSSDIKAKILLNIVESYDYSCCIKTI